MTCPFLSGVNTKKKDPRLLRGLLTYVKFMEGQRKCQAVQHLGHPWFFNFLQRVSHPQRIYLDSATRETLKIESINVKKSTYVLILGVLQIYVDDKTILKIVYYMYMYQEKIFFYQRIKAIGYLLPMFLHGNVRSATLLQVYLVSHQATFGPIPLLVKVTKKMNNDQSDNHLSIFRYFN